MACQAHVRQLAAKHADLRARGVEVAVVGPGSVGEASALAQRLKVPFPVLADPSGATMDALGLTRRVLVRQSGAVLVDRDGVLRRVHRVLNPARALPLDDLLAALAPAGPAAG